MGSCENFCLRWNDFESNVSSSFRELRAESDFFDVTLGCTDSGGRSLQAHKVILSACSKIFKSMLRQQAAQQGNANPFIYLRGISYHDLSSILNFMYHGEVNVAQEDLNSFLAVAEELQIKGLTNKGSEKSTYKDHNKWARPKLSGSPISKKQRASSPLPKNTSSQNIVQREGKVKGIKSDPDAGTSDSGHNMSSQFDSSENNCDLEDAFQDDYYTDTGGGENEKEFSGK